MNSCLSDVIGSVTELGGRVSYLSKYTIEFTSHAGAYARPYLTESDELASSRQPPPVAGRGQIPMAAYRSLFLRRVSRSKPSR
jgi:hypothetical protein